MQIRQVTDSPNKEQERQVFFFHETLKRGDFCHNVKKQKYNLNVNISENHNKCNRGVVCEARLMGSLAGLFALLVLQLIAMNTDYKN